MEKNLIKLVLLGSTGVGKSNILLRITEGKFDSQIEATTAVDYRKKQFDLDGSSISVAIYDFPPLSSINRKNKNLLKTCNGIICVYSIENKESFEEAKAVMKEVNIFRDAKSTVLILGNKVDSAERQIAFEEAENLCLKEKACFMEVSAKNDINIKEAFSKIISELVKKNDVGVKNKKEENDEDKKGASVMKCCVIF